MKIKTRNGFDYIIAGTGCAGLSLALQLQRSELPFSKVLLVDKELKQENDRTWCFWEKESESVYDEILMHKWRQFSFRSRDFSRTLPLSPYTYRLLRSADFYRYSIEALKKDGRFEFLTDEITSVGTEDGEAVLSTRAERYCAGYLFNSVYCSPTIKTGHSNLVQHFRGWFVESTEPVFNPERPVFMDFSPYTGNDCRFMYVLPYSSHEALFEYTGFSREPWTAGVYDSAISAYISKNFGDIAYRVVQREQGSIPMFESRFGNPFGSQVINIGTAGGCSKPGSGYTFHFIQQHSRQIVNDLLNARIPSAFKRKWRFETYDRIMLDVLDRGEVPASSVFADLFRNCSTQDILAFLNEESSVLQDLRIMKALDTKLFLRSALRKLFRHLHD